jgi:hypothetical protein
MAELQAAGKTSLRAIAAALNQRGIVRSLAVTDLRKDAAPMTVNEIAKAMLAAKGIMDATRKQYLGIEAGVRCSLENHAGRIVERVGEGIPKRWRMM